MAGIRYITKPKKKRNKFNSQKITVDNIVFDSIKESLRYLQLKLLVAGGVITELDLQTKFDFVINGFHVCSYFCDFSYKENGIYVVEDVKSEFTRKEAVYRIKNKLMKACHNIDITEVLKV